jgi:hypothetical protein
MPIDEPIEPDDDLPRESTEEAGRSNRVMRFARRLMDRKELAEDTKELLWTVVATSDKAKNEAVRIAAQEVRNYLSELKLKEELLELATSHSLEISISLKPLASALRGPGAAEAPPPAEAKPPRSKAKPVPEPEVVRAPDEDEDE